MKHIRRVLLGHIIASLVGLGLLLVTVNLTILFLRAGPRVASQDRSIIPPAPVVKSLEGRDTLVKRLGKESVLESIENLPNFDDTVWVMGSMGEATSIFPCTYSYQRLYIPRLNRVRKILAQVKDQRAAAVALFRKKLLDAADSFPACYRAHNAELAMERDRRLSGPDAYYRRTIYAPAATYMLGELNAHDALPAMTKVYLAPGRSPVSRLFLFYSMHLLAMSQPKEHLTPQASTVLDEYLQATNTLPVPTVIELPAWDAALEETDFRGLLGEDIGLEKQPKIRLRIYPKDLEKYEDLGGNPATLLKPLVKKLDAFAKLAYPPSK